MLPGYGTCWILVCLRGSEHARRRSVPNRPVQTRSRIHSFKPSCLQVAQGRVIPGLAFWSAGSASLCLGGDGRFLFFVERRSRAREYCEDGIFFVVCMRLEPVVVAAVSQCRACTLHGLLLSRWFCPSDLAFADRSGNVDFCLGSSTFASVANRVVTYSSKLYRLGLSWPFHLSHLWLRGSRVYPVVEAALSHEGRGKQANNKKCCFRRGVFYFDDWRLLDTAPGTGALYKYWTISVHAALSTGLVYGGCSDGSSSGSSSCSNGGRGKRTWLFGLVLRGACLLCGSRWWYPALAPRPGSSRWLHALCGKPGHARQRSRRATTGHASACVNAQQWQLALGLSGDDAGGSFFRAAAISDKCARVPSLINALPFDAAMDFQRLHMVQYIALAGACS